MRSEESQSKALMRKRDYANSYITLVFYDDKDGSVMSAGVCLYASATEPDHRVIGLYLLPGVELTLEDHLSKAGTEENSVDWDVFEAAIKRLSKIQGRTACITVHSDEYLDELLHALQPKARHIDKRAFSRAMRKSLQLKEIESVSDFMRDHLVDVQKIDKQAARISLQKLTGIKELIATVKAQIVQLKDIDSLYKKLELQCKRRDSAKATRLQILFESKDKAISENSLRVEQLQEEIAQLQKELPENDLEIEENRAQLEELTKTIARDPENGKTEHARQLFSEYQASLKIRQQNIDALVLHLRTALASCVQAVGVFQEDVASNLGALSEFWEHQALHGVVPTLDDVSNLLKQLRAMKPHLDQHASHLHLQLKELEQRRNALISRLNAAKQGMKLSEFDHTGLAMERLTQRGIDAKPVSSMVRICTPSWQGAIEGYLAHRRAAICVTPGRELDAVRILKEPPHEIYDVTVVQPNDLHEDSNPHAAANGVSSLIEGDDTLAVAYVRGLIGSMRLASNHAELENSDCALSADGMVREHGGIRRFKTLSKDDWLFGMTANAEDVSSLTAEHSKYHHEIEKIRSEVRLLNQAQEDILLVLKSCTEEHFDSAKRELEEYQTKLSMVADPATVELPERLVQLTEKKKALEQQRKDLEKQSRKLLAKLQTASDAERQLQTEIAKQVDELRKLQDDLSLATQAENYDPDSTAQTYQKAVALLRQEDAEAMLKWLAREVDDASTKSSTFHADAKVAFIKFIDEFSIGLIEERSDWNKAAAWVSFRIHELEESTLVAYEAQAEAAQRTAEEAFRNDVALRMREAIKSLENEITELNKILKACPAFSGNERYEFISTPSSTHIAIYDLIMDSAGWTDQNGSFFGSEDGPGKLITQWLEATVSGQSGKDNPLEDYRLLFNFDLRIMKDGEVVDYLSKRVGVGSNGEHRVPFYVIAGAALASSYRIKAGVAHDGAAVMLLDEAFYGMDAQNTLAAAEALSKLGLQLIMAAPDADRGKLIPVCDSIYDMIRFGPDAFGDVTHLKEPAKIIMKSDMLALHPDLLEETMSAIQANS